jgi:hypothetical protein
MLAYCGDLSDKLDLGTVIQSVVHSFHVPLKVKCNARVFCLSCDAAETSGLLGYGDSPRKYFMDRIIHLPQKLNGFDFFFAPWQFGTQLSLVRE